MIKIAKPLASKELSEKILNITKKRYEENNIITGIKACQKKIISSESKGLMIFSASVSPMDIMTHIPILCEQAKIPYIFVENSDFLNGFTCVFFTSDSDVEQLIASVKELK